MTTRKKKTSRRRSRLIDPLRERTAETSNVYQEPAAAVDPVEPASVEAPSLLQSLGDKLRQVVTGKTAEPVTVTNQKPADSSPASSVTTSEPSALPAEVESALAAIPDVVGEESAEVVQGDGGDVAEPDADAVQARNNEARLDELLALGYFDAETAGSMLEDIFDSRAESRGPHWKLTSRKRDRIARPLAACINAAIDSALSVLPEAAGNAAKSHPEWAILAVSAGTVVGPMLLADLRAARKEKPAEPSRSSSPASRGAALAGIPVSTKEQ